VAAFATIIQARGHLEQGWAFSIITIAASTMAPIAIAMPPSLMILEPRPSSFIAPNAISTPTAASGSPPGRCGSRNMMHASATICPAVSLIRQRYGGYPTLRLLPSVSLRSQHYTPCYAITAVAGSSPPPIEIRSNILFPIELGMAPK
jgi:hypothetical protein